MKLRNSALALAASLALSGSQTTALEQAEHPAVSRIKEGAIAKLSSLNDRGMANLSPAREFIRSLRIEVDAQGLVSRVTYPGFNVEPFVNDGSVTNEQIIEAIARKSLETIPVDATRLAVSHAIRGVLDGLQD